MKNKYLLSQASIFKAYTAHFDDYKIHAALLNLLKYDLRNAITTIQQVRNEASHGGSISKKECDEVRNIILGVGEMSIMSSVLKCKGLVG